MEIDDACRYLRRYQSWRRGDSDKTFDQAGLDVKLVGEALDTVLTGHTIRGRKIKDLEWRLAKCQVQRARIHSELRASRAQLASKV